MTLFLCLQLCYILQPPLVLLGVLNEKSRLKNVLHLVCNKILECFKFYYFLCFYLMLTEHFFISLFSLLLANGFQWWFSQFSEIEQSMLKMKPRCVIKAA